MKFGFYLFNIDLCGIFNKTLVRVFISLNTSRIKTWVKARITDMINTISPNLMLIPSTSPKMRAVISKTLVTTSPREGDSLRFVLAVSRSVNIST